ncbi:hypothetical protein ACFFX1_10955 [Dactylosporangium sucinum]|uniref:Uncharacterized protein n=1 Tax=Dactylosporangium sucinum TaxID=1424081 RepID=A0A917THD7_9ACTN|nr:hypothetical protein [Dactylosporangium sucinum]GGM22720.1 hypothetical protein GCM10007977_024870 [Dactylosporangium sucinum]
MTIAETRQCVVVDLEPDVLHHDLLRLEELLLTLRRWAAEAAGPDGDGWTPPGVLAGDAPVAAINRLQDALGPTQSRTELDEQRDRVERPPAGPRWYAPNGRFELAALSFVTVAAADVALLGAIAAELGRPDGDPAVREAIEEHERDLPDTGSPRERERRRLVVTAARIHGMLDLELTPDTALLEEALRAAGADRLVLTDPQATAYHRTVDRLNTMATLGDPFVRWAMGSTDH